MVCIADWPGRLIRELKYYQQEFCNRIHQEGDDFARAQGWSITMTTDRLGLHTREYRDSRFDQLRDAAPAEKAAR